MRVCTIVTWPVNPGFLWILIGITSPGFFFLWFFSLYHWYIKISNHRLVSKIFGSLFPSCIVAMPFPFAHEVSFLNHQVGTGRRALVRNAQGVRVFLRLVLVEYLAAKKGEEGFFFSENCRSFKISRDTSRYQPWKIPSKNYGHIGKFRRFFRAKCCSNATR